MVNLSAIDVEHTYLLLLVVVGSVVVSLSNCGLIETYSVCERERRR